MKTLLLVDGSSFLYRAFHAMPDLRNRHGEPTGAIYGVLNMLRKLRHDYPADYSLCVFDAKGKTFRDDWYPEYKAHRPSMPADLVQQTEPLHQAIAASGWNILMLEGVEADDVIGTLAQQARDGVRCVIATGDKDLAQLVNERVTLINTMSNETLDIAGVNAKFGVPPERIVDYLTLTGDAVDNVPGVEKVGPKTAVKWLTEYGTLDNLMQHAGEIGGVVGENLRKALDWLPQARRLITVKCDVELPQTYSELIPPPADKEQLRSLFERFEFKSWLRELNTPQQTPSPLQGEGGVTNDLAGVVGQPSQMASSSIRGGKSEAVTPIHAEYAERIRQLDDDREFLRHCNVGNEAMSAEAQQRVRQIATYQWRDGDGKASNFLSEDEVENLTIRAGTLTAAEREIINHHIEVTIKMLESLPWPRHLKNVPEYAGGHHERMDGKGYPRGLTREQMSVQARVMGIADIFEALTAKDRPYKKGKTLTESLTILGKFKLGGHIDPDLFDVFMRERVYLDYAKQYLAPEQIDEVDLSKIPGVDLRS